MRAVKWGAALIAVYLVVNSQYSSGIAGAGSSALSGLVRSFQGR